MIKKSIRLMRISQEIKKKISIILQNKINNSKLKTVTVSDVELSNDLAYAKVFVFIFKNKFEEKQKIIKILQNTENFIKKLLYKNMNLRKIPKITFLYDYSLDKGIKIKTIFNKLI